MPSRHLVRWPCIDFILLVMLGYINRCPNIKGASQETLVLKALPTRAGDARDASSISGLERSPGGEGMATHSSILA